MTVKVQSPCIYIIVNIKTKKVYIGQAQNFKARKALHRSDLNKGTHRNIHLQRAWNKYGEAKFKFYILEHCAIDKLNEREQHYLDVYMPKGLCYNIAKDVIGAGRGLKRSAETRQKMSIAQRGKKMPPMSQEHKNKISEANKGRVASKEAKKKMSESQKKRAPFSEEHLLHLSLAHQGEKFTDERRKKISDAHKGKPKAPRSAETKAKISKTLRERASLINSDVNDLRIDENKK